MMISSDDEPCRLHDLNPPLVETVLAMRTEKEQLERNVAARKAVAELLAMVPVLLNGKFDEDRFWSVLAEEAGGRAGLRLVEDAPDLPPMSEEEAIAFERTSIPWGMYSGIQVKAVDPSYWIHVTETEFNRNLARYLRSQRFSRRQ